MKSNPEIPELESSPKETFDKDELLNDLSADVSMDLVEGLALDASEAAEIIGDYDYLVQLMKIRGENAVQIGNVRFADDVIKVGGEEAVIFDVQNTSSGLKIYDVQNMDGASFTLAMENGANELRAEKNSGELRGQVKKYLQALIKSLE